MSEYTSYLNIPYTPSALQPSRQVLDLYLPNISDSNSPLLVYIHGGAWRSDSKDDLSPTLMPHLLAATSYQYPIANLEYRIAPTNDPHPAQILDIISALTLLTSNELLSSESNTPRWNRNKIYLIGHSAGGFMATTIVLQNPSPTPLFSVPSRIRESIQHIALVDCISDLPQLLLEYPSYLDYFVAEVFGKDQKVYASESPVNWILYQDSPFLNFLVLHSREDELLSLRQSELIITRLKGLLGVEEGKQEGIRGSVEVDFDSVIGLHEVLPHTLPLPNRLAKWIAASETLK